MDRTLIHSVHLILVSPFALLVCFCHQIDDVLDSPFAVRCRANYDHVLAQRVCVRHMYIDGEVPLDVLDLSTSCPNDLYNVSIAVLVDSR